MSDDAAQASLVGLQPLLDELRRLPEVMRQRLLRGAVGTGAGIIRREAAARAPLWTGPVSAGHPPPGTLRRAVYAARLARQCSATQEVWTVGVRGGAAARHVGAGAGRFGPTPGRNLDAYYAAWVEYGHHVRAAGAANAAGAAGAAGAAVAVAPRPFMRPAFELRQADAVRAMQDYIDRNLPAAVAAFTFLRAV